MGLLLSRRKTPQFKWRPQTFEQGASFTLPAPYGGLNLRDDINALKPNEARVLENWLPTTGQLSFRSGHTENATGVGSGEVETLAPYTGKAANKLIAAGGDAIFDATSTGSATELGDGFTEARWQSANYGNHLFLVNGADGPQDYDGSALAGIAWAGSGLTNTNLVNIALVRNRLWFCENGQAWVWYANVGQITAASNLTKFQLDQIASGGFCMAIGAWSVTDAGDGADDLTVFVMSTGEIIVYQGDPSTTFSLVGKYMGAPPIGRQCMIKVGGELVIITKQGYLPVSAAVRRGAGKALDLSSIDPWGKIAPGVASDAALDGSNGGWHAVLHLGIFYGNVPQTEGAISKQWVLNTRAGKGGAWTNFTKWNASSFASLGDDLYFGAMTGGKVFKVEGATDNGNPIVTAANGAFIYPRPARYSNVFTAARPIIQAGGTVSGIIGVDTDFVLRSLAGTSVDLSENTGGTPWGSPWGSAWSTGGDPVNAWFSIQGEGAAVSVKLRAQASTSDVQWYSTDLLYRPGGLRSA